MRDEIRKEREKQKKALEAARRRYKYQAEFAKKKYDRICVQLPKGYKAIIETETGGSAGAYVKRLILDDLQFRGLISPDDPS